MDTDELTAALVGPAELNTVSHRIIGCAYNVGNTLGSGFLEKVYENALAHEIRKTGLTVSQQHPLKVWYDEVIVGEYVADLLVEDQVLVELKTARNLEDAHMAQCLNYLKALGLRLCLLINFGRSKVEVKRIIR